MNKQLPLGTKIYADFGSLLLVPIVTEGLAFRQEKHSFAQFTSYRKASSDKDLRDWVGGTDRLVAAPNARSANYAPSPLIKEISLNVPPPFITHHGPDGSTPSRGQQPLTNHHRFNGDGHEELFKDL